MVEARGIFEGGAPATPTGAAGIVGSSSSSSTNNEVVVFSGTTGRVIKQADGPITLTAAGTNQNITLTPSGTGKLIVSGHEARFDDIVSFGNDLLSGRITWGGGAFTITAGTNQPVLSFNVNQSAEAARFNSGGFFLLGTTTDSSNGRLQLATHTTSAGGVGFGTEHSLFRSSSGAVALRGTGASETLEIHASSGTLGSSLGTDSTSTYLGNRVAGGSLILRSGNNVTALTLDSSQNATFAGTVNITGNALALGAVNSLVRNGGTGELTISTNASNITLSPVGTVMMPAAKTLSVASGSNQRAGNATLVAGTVTVSNTTVTANTVVLLTRKTSGGTLGTAITYTLSAGTSFTITSDSGLDTSTFSYFLIEVP